MANEPPKLHLDQLERRQIGNGKTFSASVGRIAAKLGMRSIGCTLVELAPGERAWPFHLHYGQEEFFVILSGSGTLRYDEGEYPIGDGEVFYAGTGPGTAHQIFNSSDAPLRYLAFSAMARPAEICYYPDSGKYGSYASSGKGRELSFMAHEDSGIDYYEGEE